MFVLAGAAVALAGFGVAAGYWLHADSPPTPAALANAAPMAASPAPDRKPLYYQDPAGKPDYSPVPKKTADGRDFKPVYGDDAPAAVTASMSPKPASKGKILYYRNPMGLPDTSPAPKKDSMGMDYVPVYEGEDETGIVTVSPARLQMLGVRTASVERRASLAHPIRATGIVQADESKLSLVTTKFDVVVEKLFVSTTGAAVRAGQPLARVWIDTPDTMMQRGPDVITREIDYVVALQDKNPVAIAQAGNVLRQYGLPESALAEIRRTGRATRDITITAPRSGVVLDKPAIEGMRINTGDPLFKIADLSSVWVLADVQEQDLGALQPGDPVNTTFVAYPGRTFTGVVDFVYPTMMAATRTGRVRIVLPNPELALRESMYATVDIQAKALANTGPMLVVPDSAIIDSGARQVVLIVKGQGRFEPRVVRIGARGDGFTQVVSGLSDGEQVVTSANFLIDAESNLRAALRAFTPPDGKGQHGDTP
ncbi:MAG: efflux RND transporter periplasmic adaptor subunit [Alphaproteobacteria bacterium]|nr:efflux RND transporter periplasmic adaptor subunit [Alphaproteobacteria bacterium]